MSGAVPFLAMMTGEGGGKGGMAGMMVPMLIIFAIFYFMLIRPQQRKEKDRRAMIEALKSGQRVLFGGGIIGTIDSVKEDSFMISVADGVKMEAARGAVSKVLQDGEKAEVETR